ncbi:hypothetical protein KVT40_006144 [Elsinoe batatas]|uniref:Uncharacterized protein n=1 Tax=Elsinoe batatas TaxID=2601811 RepID=A0A8K0L025_9PEZI|nr:hypothetical protein KVT40_006144 [Elsinoe batatas]
MAKRFTHQDAREAASAAERAARIRQETEESRARREAVLMDTDSDDDYKVPDIRGNATPAREQKKGRSDVPAPVANHPQQTVRQRRDNPGPGLFSDPSAPARPPRNSSRRASDQNKELPTEL